MKIAAVIASFLLAAAVSSDAAAQPYYGQGPGSYGPGPGMGAGRGYAPRYGVPPRTAQPRQALPGRGEQAGPHAIVKGGIAKLRRFVEKGGADDPISAAEFVESDIAPYFDFDHMAEWVAGPRWRGLSKNAKANLTDKLAEHFLGTLANYLGGYGKARVKIERARPARQRGTMEVTVKVATPQRRPLDLDFRFYRDRSGAWKIFDVQANDQSALVFYRSYFARTMRGNR